MWVSIATGWAVCIAIFVVIERVAARSGAGLLSHRDRPASAIAYLAMVLFAPGFVIVVLYMIFQAGPVRVWGVITKRRIDPLKAPEREWIDKEPDSFVADLVRRRQTRDPRLKKENVGNWMMWEFHNTPDAMIYDVVMKYTALKAAGLADTVIWERFEDLRDEKSEVQLPASCDLSAYIEFRLGLEDPEFLTLGPEFIAQHVALCKRFAEHRMRRETDWAWPPLEWLGRELSFAEFEHSGDGVDPMEDGAPAVLHLGGDRIRSELSNLKFLMLPGDELWTFSSPAEHWQALFGQCGVVLMRDGRPVGHIVTKKN